MRQHPTLAGVVLGSLLDLALPRRCVQCAAPGLWLCRSCADALRPMPAEQCAQCGAPVGTATAGCRECRGRELWFLSATAAFAYQGSARSLVTACKFRAYRSLAEEMADRAAPAFAAACARLGEDGQVQRDGTTVVTWVPGHRDHVLERGFNQAELLARGLGQHAGLPVAPLLRRTRHGARQSGLDRVARAGNVHKSFALREEADRVGRKLKRVMVVDDVYTTGETLNRCAEVLINADLEPHAFTFARAVRAVPSQSSLDAAVRKERCR